MILALSVIAGGDLSDSPLRAAQPQAQSFELIETIVKQGIKDGKMPGAVVVIADHDKVLYRRAFGNRQVEPVAEPMTLDTVFDLASLTKPIATTTSIVKLIDEGGLSHEQVAEYLQTLTTRERRDYRGGSSFTRWWFNSRQFPE